MSYSEQALDDLSEAFEDVLFSLGRLQDELLVIHSNYESSKAREYMAHGVCRRLKIIVTSFRNIFSLFPPTQSELLDRDICTDVEINLHAFFINMNGLLDNLAWCCVYDHKEKFNRMPKMHDVGLFKKKTQGLLGEELKALVQSERIVRWHEEYSKNFRDALAHRIPCYIPPSVLNDDQAREYEKLDSETQSLDLSVEEDLKRWGEIMDIQSAMGDVAFCFAHALDDGGRPIRLHPQLISDMRTIEEIFVAFISSKAE